MKVHAAEFIGAIGSPGQPLPPLAGSLPQVAFSGRSNVGKSSLLNRLLGRTRTPLARVSRQPGKTREVNFFRIRGDGPEFVLVDLPGYGFARVPGPVRERWGALVESYFKSARGLAGVVQLIDARRPPTPDDRRAVEYLARLGAPLLFALTKVDKVKRSGRERAVEEVAELFGVGAGQVVPFSSLTGEGRGELLAAVGELLEGASYPPI
ncbi:MAG: ribosome biogenesis GTP-binding protein YihA/YsxC [Longimicrobiaceae bacterium]